MRTMKVQKLALAAAVLLLAACASTSRTPAAPATAATPATVATPAAPAASATAASAAPRDTHEQLQGALWVQSSIEYRMVCASIYRAATAALDAALADRTWSGAVEQTGDPAGLPPAIILDLDETVLDNSLFQGELARRRLVYTRELWGEWVAQRKAGLVPGAGAFLAAARERGMAVFFVTNRAAAEEADTIANLTALGVQATADEVLCAGESDWASDKVSRRRHLARDYRIALLVGDDLGDFIPARLTPEQRAAEASTYLSWWGTRWFVLPNPMYGSWERALLGFESGLSDAQSLQRKRDLVKGFTQ
jgi:5'-nucleotidase (lipoprotein e(P4) family)